MKVISKSLVAAAALFSISTLYAVAPGGVGTSLKLWFVGDTGALDSSQNPATDGGLVRLWSNRSSALPTLKANANNDANSPVYRANSINFHNALDFERNNNNKFDIDFNTDPSARAVQQYYFVYKLEDDVTPGRD